MSFPLISFPALILQNNDNNPLQTVFGVFFLTVVFAFVVTVIVGMWKTFAKAGEPGWGVLIPIYNIYLMTRIAAKARMVDSPDDPSSGQHRISSDCLHRHRREFRQERFVRDRTNVPALYLLPHTRIRRRGFQRHPSVLGVESLFALDQNLKALSHASRENQFLHRHHALNGLGGICRHQSFKLLEHTKLDQESPSES